MTTALDLDTIEHLDFAATLPCELPMHTNPLAQIPDLPARWIVLIGHGRRPCDPFTATICDACLERLRRMTRLIPTPIRCGGCSQIITTVDELLTVIADLNP